MSGDAPPVEALHYVGYDHDDGGIISVVRTLASARRFRCVLGVNPAFVQRRSPPLATQEFPRIAGEAIGWRTFWQARRVAGVAREWLRGDGSRVFHAHSRAGLVVALWLARAGERRVVASVHCYGRQRWFYRLAARRLGPQLFWLSPAMKRHYRLGDDSWVHCIPGCVPLAAHVERRSRVRVPGLTRFGAVGALVRVKRWELILDALARLTPALRARLTFRHIGGEGLAPANREYAAQLRARTVSLQLEKTVQWLGAQPSSDGFLAETDCLVVASHEEAFSVAMLEALQAGVPVLAPDSGGATDLLTPEVNGWFFRHGRATDLARAFTMLIEGDALATARITPDAIRPFTAPVVAAQWAEVYARVLSAQ